VLSGLGPVQITLVRWVEDDHLQLREKEEGYRATQRELTKLRKQRDGDAEVLYNTMLRIRQTFDDAFGVGTAPTYLGLDPGMARVEPLVLERYAEGSVKILVAPGFTTPPPQVEGLWQSPALYAQQIQAALTTLRITLAAYGSQKRDGDVALIERDTLYEAVKTRLKWSVRLLEAVYHLAGLGAHAERLRTTFASRPSDSEEEPVGEENGEPPPVVTEPAPSEPSV